MRQIATSTLLNQTIVADLLSYTYTADADRGIFFRLFVDGAAGNGDYTAYITVQRLGAGNFYRILPITTGNAAAGVTSLGFTTILVPVKNTDVVRVYVKGLAGDGNVTVITNVWEDDSLRPTTYDRTLDVESTGEAAINLDNIKQATAPTTLTNITVPVTTDVTNPVTVGAMNAAGAADFFTVDSGETCATAVEGSVVKETADCVLLIATVFPVGAIEYTYTVYITGTVTPLEGVEVWVSTDNVHPPTNIVWKGETDAFGIARDVNGNKPFLDPGTYYFWKQIAGYIDPSSPDTEVVS